MKIVILDGYTENPGDLTWDPIKAFGEVTVFDRVPVDADSVAAAIGEADIALTNKTPISREVMERCPNLKYISVLATGYNVVDVAAAKERGIPVSNVPAYGTNAVAQAAIAMLLEITNRVGHHAEAVSAGRWCSCPDYSFWDYPLIELAGKTIGIIGFGRIGQQTGKIAAALGMRVLAYSRSVREEGKAVGTYVDLDTLLRESDVISMHCPQTEENKEMINRKTIGKMKDGVIFLNNSRGGLLCEADLAAALESGKISACGLDVVSAEPMKTDCPLLNAKNCYITPHISWASKECRVRIMDTTANNIRSFLTGAPENVVNA